MTPPKAFLARVGSNNLFRFLIVGLLGAITNLVVFYILVDILGWGATRTSVLAFIVSVTQNYLLNQRFNFGEGSDRRIRLNLLIRYITVNLVGLFANIIVMNLVLLVLKSQPKVLSQAIGIGCGTMLNFWGAKIHVFRAKRQVVGGDNVPKPDK